MKHHLPIIDVSTIDQQTGTELLDAASTWGFVYIKSRNLALTPEVVNRTFDIVRRMKDEKPISFLN